MKELEDMNNEELLSVILAGIQTLRDNEYADGQKEKPQAIYEMKVEEYNKGLNDAWEAARKLSEIPMDDYSELFESKSPYFDFSIQEVLAKIKEYEDKQKQDAEIKVGYEVYNLDRENKRIVTAIDGNKAIQLCSNGKYTVDNIDTLHWTGREDLRIKKVLERITGETNGYTSINRSDNI